MGRPARWVETLAKFNFTIEYQEGKGNIVADALSRRPNTGAKVGAGEKVELPSQFKDWPLAYLEDKDFKGIYKVKDPSCFENPAHAAIHFPLYTRRADGLLTWKGKVCVLKAYRKMVLKEEHDAPSGGHRGAHVLYNNLRDDFYWPNMKKER
jgi:hypothetical protein